jgi:uncharacterized protein YukE
MNDIYVVPDALVEFASRCEGYGDEMEALSRSLAEAALNRDAFGHIPGVAERIYTAYDEHVEQCQDAVQSSSTTMAGIGLNVALTADQYRQAEEANGGG